MSSPEYCTDCGKQKVRYKTDKFSGETGKPTFEIRCENTKCWMGCWLTTGHSYVGFWNRKCEHCGSYPSG